MKKEIRRRKGGFTLIEILVAMSLLGVVVGLVYTSVGQVSEGARSLSEDMEQSQEIRLILRVIEEDFRAMRYFSEFVGERKANPSGAIARKEQVYGSDFSRVGFHAVQPSRVFRDEEVKSDPRMHEVGYWVGPHEEDTELLVLYRREDYYLDSNLEEGGENTPMMVDVGLFEVKFLISGRRGEREEDWQEQWNSGLLSEGSQLPKALRISIGRKDEEGNLVQKETSEVNLLHTMNL